MLSQTPGNTVSNMSSTRALSDVTANTMSNYEASAVGGVNVVELMKKIMLLLEERVMEVLSIQNCITVEVSLVGVALFLSLLADKKMSVSTLRAFISKLAMSKKEN